jgi:hypothetical protein
LPRLRVVSNNNSVGDHPKYSSQVKTLASKDAEMRLAGLDSLATLLKHLPKTEHIVLLREPGFLAAMEAFLAPAALKKKETAMLALKQLHELMDDKENYNSEVAKECIKEQFASPCYAAVVRATREKDLGVADYAYLVLCSVSAFHFKALFEYPGVTEALLHGLNTEHKGIVTRSTTTISNIVIASRCPDNDILTSHPDLVTAVVNTFCKGGVSVWLRCELLQLSRSPSFLTNPSPLFFLSGGCRLLYDLLTSDEKAADFLIAHPDIIDSVKSTVDSVARNCESTRTLDASALLLTRFAAEVQLSCAKQQLEDANRMRQALETTITQMRGENGTQGELKKGVIALKKEVAAQKRKNDAQAREIAALRDRANDAEARDELAALTATASALDSAAASEVKVKIEPCLETETHASKRSKTHKFVHYLRKKLEIRCFHYRSKEHTCCNLLLTPQSSPPPFSVT